MMATPSPSPPPVLALTRVSTVCRVLRFVHITSIADIITLAHINDTFRDTLESYSAMVWRRIASGLERRSLEAFFKDDAFAWTAHNLLIIGQLDVSHTNAHPLYIAAENGAVDVVRVCLAAIPECVNVRNRRYNCWTALHHATSNGDTECVRELLASGADFTIADPRGRTALHLAAQQGHADVVRMLTEHADFAKICDRRSDDGTALYVAARKGYTDCVRVLLVAGADIAVAAKRGVTALHAAALKGKSGVVRVVRVVAAHADFAKIRDVRDTHDDNTALNFACIRGHTECVRELLAAAAEITIRKRSGTTSLIDAARWGHADIVRLLLAHPDGAKIRDVRNPHNGFTALLWAANSGRADCVREFLCAAGSDITVVGRTGDTALHLASRNGKVDVVRVLALHPDFKQIRGKHGSYGATPLHLAAFNGHTECVRELLQGGCDITLTDNRGATALHHASRQCQVDIVRLLIAHPEFQKIREARNGMGETALDVVRSSTTRQVLLSASSSSSSSS